MYFLENIDNNINIEEELTNHTVVIGDSFNLTCEFLADNNVTVIWRKDNVELV